MIKANWANKQSRQLTVYFTCLNEHAYHLKSCSQTLVSPPILIFWKYLTFNLILLCIRGALVNIVHATRKNVSHIDMSYMFWYLWKLYMELLLHILFLENKVHSDWELKVMVICPANTRCLIDNSFSKLP